jgi:hypothetical protein
MQCLVGLLQPLNYICEPTSGREQIFARLLRADHSLVDRLWCCRSHDVPTCSTPPRSLLEIALESLRTDTQDLKFLEALLVAGANVNRRSEVERGWPPGDRVSRAAFHAHVSPQDRGLTPLCYAMSRELHLRVVDLLLNHKANPNPIVCGPPGPLAYALKRPDRYRPHLQV